MRNIKCIIVVLILHFSYSALAGVGGFYQEDNKHKGFYWFEQKKSKHKQSIDKAKAANKLTPEIASSRLEKRRQELEKARSVMLEMGFNKDVKPEELYEAIAKYKRLEAQMYDGSLRLAKGWEMANFLHPELADNINNPVNVPANRIKRRLEQEKRSGLISQFQQKFDLVLFTKEHCPYCNECKPVMKRFIDMYGFDLDVADLSSNNHTAMTLAKRLNIAAVPSLVAISKDGSDAFEVIRGFASITEIEGNIELGVNWLKAQGKWQLVARGEERHD